MTRTTAKHVFTKANAETYEVPASGKRKAHKRRYRYGKQDICRFIKEVYKKSVGRGGKLVLRTSRPPGFYKKANKDYDKATGYFEAKARPITYASKLVYEKPKPVDSSSTSLNIRPLRRNYELRSTKRREG